MCLLKAMRELQLDRRGGTSDATSEAALNT
jgi:hypothetical protein